MNRIDASAFEQAWAGTPLTRKASDPVPAEQKEQIFSTLFQGPNGLKRVAFAMQTPLKDRLDYVAVGRKLLLVDELPQGEVPVYDLDIPEFTAVKVAARGTAPIVETNVRRIEIPTFVISVTESVKWEEVQIRRYPVFDRAKERTAIANALEEDKIVFDLLEEAANASGNTPVATTAPVSRALYADLYGSIASRQLVVGAYVIHPTVYKDILKMKSDEFDQVSLNITTETGQFGVLFGSRLIVSTRVPEKRVYAVTTPDKLGRIPERKAVEIKIWDNVKEQEYDIVSWEQVGFGIHNVFGVQSANIA